MASATEENGTPEWLGVERAPGGFERDDPAPASAAEAIAVLECAFTFWQDKLRELPESAWWESIGPIAGEYADADKASLVLHQLDEQIHQGPNSASCVLVPA